MTALEAREDLASMLYSAWSAMDLSDFDVDDYPKPQLLWEDEASEPPPNDAPFARAALRSAGEDQTSFGDAHGSRTYTARGVLLVQCFAPLVRRGSVVALAMANTVKQAFRGQRSPGNATFDRCSTNNVGKDPRGFWQVNAVIPFSYDEVQ